MSAAKAPNLGIVIAGLLLGILMASMDSTIVATAMGNIVGELGGMDKFVWVTSAYLVAEMAGMPIFGKLSDMYGRKKFFIFGIIVFMAGSALCGTADTITQLAAYRAVQGIGGGALVPIAFAIMFDAVPLETRGKLGGAFGAVFGLSSIFGPLLGAYITDHIAWQWIFYINLPLGLLAFVMVVFFYKESHEHSKQPIDWLGAGTLLGSVICLMFALELGGKEYAWGSSMILGLFAAFAILAAVFLFVETRAKEPIISFALFKKDCTPSAFCVRYLAVLHLLWPPYTFLFLFKVYWGFGYQFRTCPAADDGRLSNYRHNGRIPDGKNQLPQSADTYVCTFGDRHRTGSNAYSGSFTSLGYLVHDFNRIGHRRFLLCVKHSSYSWSDSAATRLRQRNTKFHSFAWHDHRNYHIWHYSKPLFLGQSN